MKVGIVMGSISDKAIGEKVINILKKFGVDFEIRVISAHRTPNIAVTFARDAEANDIEVVIAIAGKAAHLAGVMAGITSLPVIGIPAKSSTMDGLDSLLSVVQMPKGIPVATVAIDGGENGGLLAIQMLSIKYPDLRKKFTAYKKEIMTEVINMDEEIQSLRR